MTRLGRFSRARPNRWNVQSIHSCCKDRPYLTGSHSNSTVREMEVALYFGGEFATLESETEIGRDLLAKICLDLAIDPRDL